MKEVQYEFRASINFSAVIMLPSMFPLSFSVHLCFVYICIFSSLYWQGIFQNFSAGKILSTSTILSLLHLMAWLFHHSCFTHVLTMTQVLALPETAVEIQRKICSYMYMNVLDCDLITCFPLQAERIPVTRFNKKKLYPYQKQDTYSVIESNFV